MICQYCKKEFEEKNIHESHDVPCYLFVGNRKGQKNQADKWGRHWLCLECHEDYEEFLRNYLKKCAKEYSIEYFKEEKDGDTNTEETASERN